MKTQSHPNPFIHSFKALSPLLLGLLVVLSLPLIVQVSGWQWSPDHVNPIFSLLLYWVSQSMPVVGVMLVIWTLYTLRLNLKATFILLVCILLMLALGVGVKTAFKELWHEPRPYMIWFGTKAKNSSVFI